MSIPQLVLVCFTMMLSTAVMAAMPVDANLINVKTQYGAKGDGVTDDTQAIRRATVENLTNHRTIYFPTGTYLIREGIDWLQPDGTFGAFTTWQGDGVGRTVIQLADKAPAFQDPAKPRAVVRLGSLGKRPGDDKDGGGNRAHNNYLFDMTIHSGKGNPGAIGIDYVASNTGAMVDIAIISGDGDGVTGLKLTREVGPCLLKNIRVDGFDTGIEVRAPLYGITFQTITLNGQRKVGFSNDMNVAAIRNLTSRNTVPAIRSKGGVLVLLASQLAGGAADVTAIELEGAAVIRDVHVDGYGVSIKSGEQSLRDRRITHHVSGKSHSLFAKQGATPATLKLPVIDPPEVSNADGSKWVNVLKFHDGPVDRKTDIAPAVQKAIDSGAETIYFPHGWYNMEGTVIVRGNVRRIIGFNSWLNKDKTIFRFENKQPVVLERFNDPGTMVLASNQPVLLAHLISPEYKFEHPTAKLLIENVVGGSINITKGQSVHAWQLDIELPPPKPMIDNNGGLFWVLGYKTEFGATVLATRDGGKSEVLGGLFYAAQGVKDPQTAAIVVENAECSVSFQDIAFYDGGKYPIIIRDTQGGKTLELTRKQLSKSDWVIMPLYTTR